MLRWKTLQSDPTIQALKELRLVSPSVALLTGHYCELENFGLEPYSGQILSYTKMQGQLQDVGNTTTLANYLHLLDTVGLLGGLEKFSSNKLSVRRAIDSLNELSWFV
jgi:hypothetical protein